MVPTWVLVQCGPIVHQKLHRPHTQGITDWLSPINGKTKKRWQNDKKNMEEWNLVLMKACYSFKISQRQRNPIQSPPANTHFSKLSNFNTNNWIPAIYFQVWNKGEMGSFAMLGCVFDGHILLENWEVPSVPSFFFGLPPYSSPYSSR
jgi:hypothetical protein